MSENEIPVETEEMVPSFDGTKLYVKKDILERRTMGTIVIVHGLCEHQGRYDYLTQCLLNHFYNVYRFDHRGHGRSEGERIFYSNKDELVDDVNVIVDKAKAEQPDSKIYLIGHSMGGYGVALYGSKYPGKVDGIVSSGALVANINGMGSDIPAGTPADAKFPNALGNVISHDQSIVDAYAADPLVEKEICAGLFYALADGTAWLKDNLVNFTDPVLIMHGGDDKIVNPQEAQFFYDHISSKDKEIKVFDGLYHEIFNEPERDDVIGYAIAWLYDHFM